MSTENEGNEGITQPAAPSVPPVPAAPPEGRPATPAPGPEPVAAPVSDATGQPPQAAPAPPSAPSASAPSAPSVPASAPGAAYEQSAPPVPASAPQDAPYAPPAQPQNAPYGQNTAYAQHDPYAQNASYAGQHNAHAPYGGPGAPQGQAPGATPPQQGGGWPPAPPALPSYGGDPYGGGAGAGGGWGAPAQPAEQPRRKRSGHLLATILIAALVAGGVGGSLGYVAGGRNNDEPRSTTLSAADTPKDLKRAPGSVSAVSARALPSVVTIEAKSSGGGAGGDIGGSGQEEQGGTGTGFVYDQEGHILTNNHVVDSAAEGGAVSVTFSNGKKHDAEVVGRAQGYDVAVLRLKNAPSGLAPLPLGDSDKVAVGDSTIAIGAPFGLSNTVTTGIISAKNRPVASGDASSNKNSYMSALQTDASINPGNSGGPLLDARGAVIGINSAIQSTGGGLGQSQAGSIGLGFAIPINQAKNVAEQLIKTGKPVYPVIGATVDVSGRGPGAQITTQGADGTSAVPPNGPAAKAGLKAGDVITEFDGKPIDSGPTLIGQIWNHKPGDRVKLTFERDGKEKTTTVTLGKRTGDS